MRSLKSYWLLPLLVLSCVFILTASIPNVPNGTWQTWNPMGDVRSRAATVQLQDGRVLIIGGSNANGPVASADLFGTDGNFSATSAMQSPRSGHTATVLSDGRVLVAGGTTSGGGITNSAEIYDPSADSWTLLSGTMVDARSGHTASLLPDGRVLLAGGENSGGAINSLEIFDPSSGNFSGVGVMTSARMNHAAASLQDGRVLLLGGSDGTNPLASVDVFDPGTGTVSAGPNLSAPRVSASATTTLDGKVAVIGGNNGASSGPADLATADILVADPSTGQLSSSLSASHLLTPRSGHQSFLLPKSNAILVIGGSSSGTDLNSAELYYSWADTFQATGSMSVPRPGFVGSASSHDGMFLAAGGTNLSSTELYGFATVKTDALDYPPGSTVTITGSGWQPGETVALTLVESPLIDTHGPFTTVADAFGNISNSSFVTDLHDVNVKFTLTTVGSASQAQTTFTDSTATNTSLTSAPNSSSAGQNVTFTATVRTGNTQGSGTLVTSGTVGFYNQTGISGPNCNTKTGTQIGTQQNVSGSGTATVSFTFSSGGAYTIGACYTGTGGNGPANSQSNSITQTVNQAPAIDSTASITFTVGTAGSFTVTATGFPAPTFSETGALPSGVTLSSAGVLSGTPAANTGGTYPITITASNGVSPNATQNFTLTVNQAPAITSTASTTFTVGTAGSFTVTATGNPAPSIAESGSLPSGVTYNSTTQVLSGTPAAGTGGTYNITFTASNGVTPNAVQNFTLTVNQALSISSAASTTFTVGSAGSFTVTATGFPAPTFSETGALPSGVTLTTAGVLSGTPALGSVGSYPITIKASNGINPDATQAFILTVNKATAAFTALTASQSIAYGTTTISLSGRVSGPPVLTGTVSIAINGTTVSDIPLNGNPNNFGPVTFNTSTIPASTTPYTITYSYSGDANSTTATDTSTTLTVNKATAAFSNLASQTITYGTASVTLTGTISAATGLPPTTETVSITINGSTMATPIGANGAFSASFDTHAIPASVTPYTITYNYAGDTNFSSASNTGTTLTVNKAASGAALGSSLNPSFSGQQVTFTATITVPAGVPGGTVQFQDGGVNLGSPVAVSNNGGVFAAQLQTASLSVATHNITAIYSGDANFNGSTSNTVAQVVKSAVTITSISAPTITYGADGLVTVTVAAQDPSAGTPSGNVTLSVNGGAPITQTLVGGSTTFTITKPDAGSYSLSANYAAQGKFNASSTTGTLQVNPAQATLSFGPLAFTYDGNPKPVSVSTTPADLTGVSITYSGGTAPTIAGSYTVGASLTNPNYTATPISGTETISPAPVAVTVPDTTVTYDGTPKSVTAVLSPAVAFAVTYTGISPTVYATSFTAPTEPGSYTVVATVTNPNYTGSGSGTLTISQKDPALVLALLTGMPEPSAYGTRAYFELTTATSPCPTGHVDFYVDGSSTSSQTVNLSDSPCTHQPIEFSTATLMPGTHSVSAVYSGDAHYLNQTSPPVSHQVVADATTVTLATSATEVFVGDSVTLTATVTPATPLDGTAVTPTGTVQFYDNTTTLLDQKPLTMNGSAFIAVLNINSLAAGPHSITATYVSANGDFAGSSSPVSLETVDKITPTITWANPADIVYGTKLNDSQLNATATDAHNGNIPVAGTFVYDPAKDTLLAAGTRNLSVTFTPADSNTYTSQTATVTINVTAATLTVTADDASRPYGADNPTFTFKYSGFVNNEDSTIVTTASTCTTTATLSSNVGTYPITCSGGVASNYTFNYVDGKLTVNAATLTASVAGDPTKTYDGNTTATLNAGNFSLSGVVGNDSITVTKTTGTYNSADVSTANTVTVNLASTDFTAGTGTLLTNYVLPTSASGPGHITKANSVITVTPYSLTYDGSPHTATGTAKGVKGESLTGLDLSSTTHTNAQDYPSDPWTFTDTTGNYNNANGTTHDHIDKANAAIVVTPYNLTYDGNPHTATGTAKGVETNPADLSSLLHLDGTTHTAAGDYPSDAWTFDGNGNYNPASGTVHDHIDKANAAIVVTPYSLTYDGNPHTATGTATGVKGESLSGLDLTGTTHTNAQDYSSDPWTFTDSTGNYNSTNGTTHDHIDKANAAIVVTPYSLTYDGNPHTATGTAKGVETTPADLSSLLHLGGTTHTAAGDYPSDAWTFDGNGNYNPASGTVHDSIAKANATINVTPYSVTYDGNPHTATDTATGVKGETLSGLNLTGTTHTTAGTYATDAWTFTDSTGNYNNASGAVSDSIAKATPIVTWANPANITYGTALSGTQLNATFTWMVSGSTVTVPGTATYSPASGTVLNPGQGQTLSVSFTPTDTTDYTNASKTVTINVLFASASSGLCDGDLSHTILQPINADGTSVFKMGSTVPTKFRVCDAFGNSVGPTTAFSNIVKSYNIVGAYGGTITSVDETVSSTTPDTTFRWDPTAQQWIFNTATGASTSLNSKNYTYWFQIVLIDGTIIGSSGTNGLIPSAPFAGKQGYQYGMK